MLPETETSQPGSTTSWLCPRLPKSLFSVSTPRPACETQIPTPWFSRTTLPRTAGFARRRIEIPCSFCPDTVFRSTIPAASSETTIPCVAQLEIVFMRTTGEEPVVMQIPEPPALVPLLPAPVTVLFSMCPLPLWQILIPSEKGSMILLRVIRGSASLSTRIPIPEFPEMVFASINPRPAKHTAIPSPSLSRIVLLRTTGFARFIMYSPTDWFE
eukprot:3520167-Rhodomonas_salina.2